MASANTLQWTKHFTDMAQGKLTPSSTYLLGNSRHHSSEQTGSGSSPRPVVNLVTPVSQEIKRAKTRIKRSRQSTRATSTKRRRTGKSSTRRTTRRKQTKRKKALPKRKTGIKPKTAKRKTVKKRKTKAKRGRPRKTYSDVFH